MKVLCIDDDFDFEGLDIIDKPIKGNKYTVLSMCLGRVGIMYYLKELPKYLWDSFAFKPIKDDNFGYPCAIDNNKPEHSSAPTCPPVIVGLPGT